MKYSSSILFTAGLAAAQSTVVNILFPFADQQDNGASVISAAPTATKYFVTCPPGTSDEDCGLADGVEVLYGPSTMAYVMSYSGIFTASADCQLNPSKDEATCSGKLISDEGTSIIAEVMSGYSTYIMPVTVTAGLEKLSAGAGATNTAAPSSSPATDAPSASTMTTAAAPTNSEGSGDDGAAADPTSTLSTGGMPRVTQNVVIMGAAALVGGAILL
ncbi:uncharacterized protein B0H64DRAFT_374862 [Chaetomium fimeti]|uniref:Uncharacterized protein n=1 Tax=Chaetomium fimeti TaxID=1854472 RepID=A0AAE0HCJ1_9PEZI|nr:hypothetical protein B0H64DRAFT_374862 [Chaetomium fimeti]